MAGWVSQAGVSSLYLARMGYSWVKNILDGEDGFWKYSGSKKWGSDRAIADLGKQWHFMDID
jgi:2-methylcitrate dehydratase PrpD